MKAETVGGRSGRNEKKGGLRRSGQASTGGLRACGALEDLAAPWDSWSSWSARRRRARPAHLRKPAVPPGGPSEDSCKAWFRRKSNPEGSQMQEAAEGRDTGRHTGCDQHSHQPFEGSGQEGRVAGRHLQPCLAPGRQNTQCRLCSVPVTTSGTAEQLE